MKRIILAALVGVLLGACARADMLSSSERHISIRHGNGSESMTKAFQMADQHCLQYGKTAIQTVSNTPHKALTTSTFRCE